MSDVNPHGWIAPVVFADGEQAKKQSHNAQKRGETVTVTNEFWRLAVVLGVNSRKLTCFFLLLFFFL